MKGDFSRVTFDASSHYVRVLMQQGRVQLDADVNEQTAILVRYLEALASDLIGPHGGPRTGLGFGLELRGSDLRIYPGRYYVDGILCELEPSVSAGRGEISDGSISYFEQPDLPLNAGETAHPDGETFLGYLDVWERHLTALDDPRIRDVGLG